MRVLAEGILETTKLACLALFSAVALPSCGASDSDPPAAARDRDLVVTEYTEPLPAALNQPWPAEPDTGATILTNLDEGFEEDLSGAHWNPNTRTLWVCTNKGPSRFWALKEDNQGSFHVARNSTGVAVWQHDADLEGITQADYGQPYVYLMQERTNTIHQFDTSVFGRTRTVHRWNVTEYVGDNDNKGPEGITFVPDAWLHSSGFTDQTGEPYISKNGMHGLMFVARELGGVIFVFDLDPADDTHVTFVGEYATSRPQNAGLEFDRSNGVLYILHNTGPNYIELADLASAASENGARKFNTKIEHVGPNDSNLEGFALTPEDTGERWAFVTDDSNEDGAALMWFKQFAPPVR